MKALLLAFLAAVGLSGCYAEGVPYGAYDTGYYSQPSYGYGYGYGGGGPVYVNSYGHRGYRGAPPYRSGAVVVSSPGYRAAPVYRGAPAYRTAPAYRSGFGGHAGRRF